MPGRVVLFGATGYTGRLAAAAMLDRGMRPVAAARSRERLEALASELGGGLDIAVADVADPPSVRALVEPGDVLVTTVGPFVRWGSPAAAAASIVGAHYLDSTGEPPFIREVFERYGHVAEKAGCGMLTAFGYDYVPGNVAGALALRRAGELAVRVDTGYFLSGADPGTMSGGTRASLISAMATPSFTYRDGRVQSERGARRHRTFAIGPKRLAAVSVGSSEQFALPRLTPRLREVNTYLGWFGPASRAMQVASAGTALAMKLPGGRRLLEAVGDKLSQGSTGGPDAEARARVRSWIVAIAYDAAGRELAEVQVSGVDSYTFTGRMLAWGAERAAAGDLRAAGALGPVDGFGLDELVAGCAEAGMVEDEGKRAPTEPLASARTPAAMR